MANYAAVLSLIHTLNNIKNHPKPPISLHQSHLDSLTLNLTFFQHFLESYPTQEDDDLDSRIAAAANAAEDVIETHIVHQIHQATSTSGHARNISSVDLYGDLERVIQEMDLIKTDVMEIIQHKKIMTLTPHLSSGAPASSTWQSTTKPVFDDAFFIEVLDKLTGQQSGLQIIPIVGMGGIGKTTFALAIYSHLLIVQHFDIMAWVTISQEYSRANVLKLLCQQIKGGVNGLSEDEMGLILHKHLCGRRYLIVMDDMWSVEALDEVKSFFPDNNGGSRIMITTRLSNLNCGSPDIHIQVLDEDKSWNLLCKTVFGELDCPIELKDIGKEIAKNCRGLPLSIAVIGGLLIKSRGARAHWEYILQNLSSLINLEADEYCQQLLFRSYKELPIYLKPCFLYMGVFPEDSKINVSHVIKLWISEGILKPNDDKSLEDVAAEYLKELIDRNLIMVHELRWNGEAKICKIHDLLRDVCLREAKRQKFLCVLRPQTPQGSHGERRICIVHEVTMEKYSPEFLHAVESASFTRSFLYCVHDYLNLGAQVPFVGDDSPSLRLALLRVHSTVTKRSHVRTASNNAVFEQANLRYVYLNLRLGDAGSSLSSLCSLLWNVQTLKVYVPYYQETFNASKIWGMPLLRHVMLDKCILPDPPEGEDKFVLDNLRTLSCIQNFIFSEEAIKRIPYVKKLKVQYRRTKDNEDEGLPNFCLNNLGRLQKLESFSLYAVFADSRVKDYIPKNLVCFPHSLKKLSLDGTRLNWEDLNIRVGTLPLLQVLKLAIDACVGPKWETVEGKFCSLRVLIISQCDDLESWDTEDTHFPCLDHLRLKFLTKLEEIPLSVGDIPTLKFIQVEWCRKSVTDSARRIKEEQLENGNEDLQLKFDDEDEEDDQTNWDEDQVDSDEE